MAIDFRPQSSSSLGAIDFQPASEGIAHPFMIQTAPEEQKPISVGSQFVKELATPPLEIAAYIPSSAINLAGNLYQAVRHPIQTFKGLVDIGQGAVEKVTRPIAEKVEGSQVEPSPQEQSFNHFVGFLKNRYGSVEALGNTIKTDPVGFAFDASIALDMAGSGLKAAGLSRAGEVASQVSEAVNPLNVAVSPLKSAGSFLFRKAADVYQSALKPSTTLSDAARTKIIQTGLREGISLTSSGVQKTAETIDKMEEQLGKAISDAAGESKMVPTAPLADFVEEAKKFFSSVADVKFSEKAVKTIDGIYKNFVKKYGDTIPVDEAQLVKVNTYRLIRDYYDQLSAPAIEGQKQLIRGLKEGIVKVAPEAGDINERLKALYEFDEQLSRASGRIGNLNLLGLGTKVLATVGGKTGLALSLLNQVFGPEGKSIAAIGMSRLGKALKDLSPSDKAIAFSRYPEAINLYEQYLTGTGSQASQ